MGFVVHDKDQAFYITTMSPGIYALSIYGIVHNPKIPPMEVMEALISESDGQIKGQSLAARTERKCIEPLEGRCRCHP